MKRNLNDFLLKVVRVTIQHDMKLPDDVKSVSVHARNNPPPLNKLVIENMGKHTT